jgi:glycosyltransferase involved in cell wall biosynthesis
MSDPRVSVVIPYFNASAFIEGALASIRAQAYAPLEIILVDDGSTDDIATRAAAWPDVIYIRQENRGPAAARNAGIARATGEVIAFLDADDRWPANKLALQLARLQDDPTLDMVSGRIQYVNLPGAEQKPLRFHEGDKLVHVHLGAAIMRRRAFDKVGVFNETMRVHEDQDWYLRAREQDLKIAILGEVTLIYQLHAGNMTRTENLQDRRLLAVLKASIDRRKAKQGGEASDLRPMSAYDDKKGKPD